MKIISWFSCGCSSFLATYIERKRIDEIIYTHVENQHPDSLRFLHDCETLLGRQITILQSEYYRDIYDVFRARRFISSPKGAPCTMIMKKQVRKKWEYEHPDDYTYIWGFDYNEKDRADRLFETMPNVQHLFPLIENHITKNDVHGICKELGLKRPVMYDMGYNNNNCVGCVKGGMGYWNKIRIDFPDVFLKMAKLERELNCTCIKGIYLDELDPERGRQQKIIMPDCDIFCEMAVDNMRGETL